MKLLRIVSSTDPKKGGVIEAILQTSVAMKKLGHEVDILSLDSPNSSWLESLPVKVHAVGPGVSQYAYCLKIKKWLVQHHDKYDSFIIDGIWQYHSVASREALLKSGRQYCVYTHGMLDPWFKRRFPFKHMKKWLFWPWGDYRVLRDAFKVLFTTEEEKEVSKESFWLYRCNGEVAPIGTTAFDGDARVAKQRFYEAFPVLSNKPYLLYLSRIHPKKGIDLLIRAFSMNSKLMADRQLVIAGPDQAGWRKELEAMAKDLGIQDRITWTGMLTGDLKWGAYYNAEAFVLPSHQENFGIVVAEALSCGVPVLISNKVNIWREVDKENAGLIDEDTDVGCGALIRRWLELDENKRSTIVLNTQGCFKKHFEINQAADNLVKVLGF